MRTLPREGTSRRSSSRPADAREPDAHPGEDRGRHAAALRHRDDIQGLRAVAVLLVALGHAGVRFLNGGFIGVDVFFVLSGFLITGLLLDGARKRGYVSLRDFYARRAKRILPAAALTLVVTDIVAYHLLNFVRAKQAVLDSIWAAFFAANVQFARQGVNYFAQGQPPSPMQHYWSLAVEEQFYLVWPLVLTLVLVGVAMHRRRRRERASDEPAPPSSSMTRRLAAVIILAGLASLAWSIYLTHTTPKAAYFSAPARAWELALGAALAIGASGFLNLTDQARALLGWAGILAIGVAAVLYSDATPFPGFHALLPTVGTAMVIAAGIGNERSRRGVGGLLGRPPLRYVGDRSYAFYLWHWPVLVIAAYYVGHDISVGPNLLLLAGAFLLSIVSYGLVENPIRRSTLTRPIATSAVLWGTSVALVVSVATFNLRAISAQTAATEAVGTGPLPTPAPFSPTPEPGGSPTTGPTGSSGSGSIPAVIAAVRAARHGSPIPSPLAPPLGQLLDDRYEFPSQDCYAMRGSPAIETICPLGDVTADRTIVVFGDSHAREWIPDVLRMGADDGWKVVPLIELGCGPTRYDSICSSYYQWAVEQVQRLHPDVILIGGALKAFNPDMRRESVTGTTMLIRAVKPLVGQVVVIGDPPEQVRQPVDCLLARGATLATCTRTLTHDQVSVYRDVEQAALAEGATFIDTIGWFCFQNQCPMVVGNTVTFRDNDHVTETYVLELRELFRAAFVDALKP